MRKALIVATCLSSVTLTGYFLLPGDWGSDPRVFGAAPYLIAGAPSAVGGSAQISPLRTAANDIAASTASRGVVVAMGRDAMPQSIVATRRYWADTWREHWFRTDAPERVDLLEPILAQADQLATDGDPFTEPQRDTLNGLLLEAARAEQNAAVLLKLLPVLAVQERNDGEPILTAYLANNTLTAEVRATAAEILVETGWWSLEQLQGWLDDPARVGDDRVAILEELADTLKAWAEPSYGRSESN